MNPLKEWTNGTPENNYQDGTQLDAADFESWSKELVAVLASAGIAPEADKFDQLLTAIRKIAWNDPVERPATLAGFGITDAYPASGGKLSGTLIEKSDVALNAAASLDLGAAAGNFHIVSIAAGAITLSDLGTSAPTGTRKTLFFSVTGGTLKLGFGVAAGKIYSPGWPGGASLAVANEDVLIVRRMASGVWLVESIIRSGGGPHLAALPGEVRTFMATSAPNGFLEASGQRVSRTAYPALYDFAVNSGVITSDAIWLSGYSGYFSTGDAATTFRLPDLRGEFLRMADKGRGIDAGRVVGSAQADNTKIATGRLIGSLSSGVSLANGSYVSGSLVTVAGVTVGSNVETRPRNIAVLACIKY